MKIVIIGIINAAEYINEGNMKHEWRGGEGADTRRTNDVK